MMKLDETLAEKQLERFREELKDLEAKIASATASREASAKADTPAEDLGFSLATATLPLLGLDQGGGQSFGNVALVLANLQSEDGRWSHGMARFPIESSDFVTTAYAVRTLQRYAPAQARQRIDRQIARAMDWLENARPTTTDDLIGRLYGLYWGTGLLE